MRPGIICTHVADHGKPACAVEFDKPVMDDDSGWMVLCEPAQHPNGELLVVDLDRYMDQDPTLQQLRQDLQQGFRAHRAAAGAPWVVEPIPPEPEEPAEAA